MSDHGSKLGQDIVQNMESVAEEKSFYTRMFRIFILRVLNVDVLNILITRLKMYSHTVLRSGNFVAEY